MNINLAGVIFSSRFITSTEQLKDVFISHCIPKTCMLSVIDTFSKHFFNKYFQMEKVIPYCQLSNKILYTLSKISQIDFYLGSFQSSADLLITNMYSFFICTRQP